MTASTADIGSVGYGAFWIANSITSLGLGRRNRKLQQAASERNMEFQLEMERAKNITEDKRLQEEITFKRRMVALARKYKQEESTTAFKTQLQAIELGYFLNYCWPLNSTLPNTIINYNTSNYDKLNIILTHPNFLLPQRMGEPNREDSNIYLKIEDTIKRFDASSIGNIDFWVGAANKFVKGNSDIMNIHFIMSQLPTLVVYPIFNNGKMKFNAAVWEAQAARPLMRPLFEVAFNPYNATHDNEYRTKMETMFRSAVAVIIGAVRDSYMLLTQGKAPTLNEWLNDGKHDDVKQVVWDNKEIKQFINQEYSNMIAALDDSKNPKLLDIFDKDDLTAMKQQIMSNQLKM